MIEKINKWVGLATLVVVLLIGWTLVGGNNQSVKFGGVSNFDAITLDSGNLTITNGNIVSTSGNLTLTNGTFAVSGLSTLNGGRTDSYSLATTTSATTYTLTSADIGNYDTIRQTLSGGATTFTLPATSTLTTLVPSAGDRAETCWLPLTNTLTFAAGTGIDLMVATSTSQTGAFDLTITAGGVGCITWFRQTDTDITAAFLEYENAD